MSLRDVLGSIGPWPRRIAALVCLLLAAVTALDKTPGRAGGSLAAGTPVVTAARDLPAGHLVRVGDLRLVRMSPVPGALGATSALVNRVLAGPVARGEAITGLRLVGAQLVTGLPTGTVAMPITVADDLRGLIGAGTHVDVLSVPGPDTVDSSTAPAHRLVSHVLVLAATPVTDSNGSVTRLVVAVDRDVAVKIAGDQAVRTFRVVADTP